jgi:hypothetical protein
MTINNLKFDASIISTAQLPHISNYYPYLEIIEFDNCEFKKPLVNGRFTTTISLPNTVIDKLCLTTEYADYTFGEIINSNNDTVLLTLVTSEDQGFQRGTFVVLMGHR